LVRSGARASAVGLYKRNRRPADLHLSHRGLGKHSSTQTNEHSSACKGENRLRIRNGEENHQQIQ